MAKIGDSKARIGRSEAKTECSRLGLEAPWPGHGVPRLGKGFQEPNSFSAFFKGNLTEKGDIRVFDFCLRTRALSTAPWTLIA